jgi:hypothetical protein
VSRAIEAWTEPKHPVLIQLSNGDKQTLTESLQFIQATASQILTAISPGD